LTKKNYPLTLLFVQRKGIIARLLGSRAIEYSSPLNLRGVPSSVCLNCGHVVFRVNCIFEENEIALWFTDAVCDGCEARVTVPTPVD